MVKTMQIGDREVTFSTAFAWAFIYKSQFGEDPVKTLMPTVKGVFSNPAIESIEDEEEKEREQVFALMDALGITGIAQIAWSMAKLADNTIPAPLPWIESFGDDFPVMDMVEELITEAIVSCFATKKSGAPIPAEPTK
ncbi:MAG: hypothetical protein IJT32_01050 [Lachnospiraceae bacterium]|nr:hypothetical protein [Lachnospiraceae bacterium]